MGYVFTGNRETADMYFEQGRFGSARCEYDALLRKTKQYTPDNTQLIDYCERKIAECNEEESKYHS